ncbi:LuxR family transcriptional regulator [Nonomuraea turcica]|uniref:LuxR family transcriptional regulator n=1 Tax=Nonomuraea sp. G32 TaxID=3067274 RepID=UPI00273CA433|nr:LuxR family transcriptional regulator [Nonomuraea sp. G32]MDP4504013.1 LuxR family transcriptional regulator [Nonomuraea sp. G32]
MFDVLGLSPDAQAVYREMLQNPLLRAAELAARVELSPMRLHDVLGELTRLALIQQSWERPGEFHVVDPEISLTALLAQREADLLQRQREVTASRSVIADVIAEFAARNWPPHRQQTKYLRGIDAIRTQIEGLGRQCQSDIMAFVDGGPQTEENMKASRPQDRAVLERGARMRSIYLDSLANDPSTLSYARWLVEQGAEVRTLPVLPLRMIIFDRRVAMLPQRADETAAGAMLVYEHSVIIALCALFEKHWQEAASLGIAPERQENGLTRQQLSLLNLMAEGNTDEVCARKLGVSVRTERRLAAEILAALNAKSRFQAGVLAARAGWLDAEPVGKE